MKWTQRQGEQTWSIPGALPSRWSRSCWDRNLVGSLLNTPSEKAASGATGHLWTCQTHVVLMAGAVGWVRRLKYKEGAEGDFGVVVMELSRDLIQQWLCGPVCG